MNFGQTQKFFAKYSGEVVNNEDPEKLGRLEVTVPTVLEDLCVWARPCLPFGHFYIPANETKIWVEFEAGDPEFPIWTGVWYPEGSVPPEADEQPPNNRVIQTPSGHTIELKDDEGEEKIVIRHKLNSFISIDKDGSVVMSNQEGSHIYLNSVDGAATFMEQHGNLVAMSDEGVQIVNKDGTTIELKDGNVRVIAADAVQVSAKDVLLSSSTVTLGDGGMEPAVLGQTFAIEWAKVMAHTHATAVGPTGPPIPVPNPLTPGAGLSQAVKVK